MDDKGIFSWRTAPSGLTHAFYYGSPVSRTSVCHRARLETSQLPRHGEAVRPCKTCVRRLVLNEKMFKAIVAAGKRR